MPQPEPLRKESLLGGLGQVWRRSPLWRFTLLAALAVSGVFLLAPPWTWHAAHKHAPAAKPAAARVAATASATPPAPVSAPLAAPPSAASSPAVRVPQPAAPKPLLAHAGNTPQAPAQADLAAEDGGPVLATPVAPTAPAPSGTQGAPDPVAQGSTSLGAGISPQIANADENCGAGGPMGMSLWPSAPFGGQVVGFLSRGQALELLDRSEREVNGRIDPAYLDNLRAIIHLDGRPPGARVVVLVPDNMMVHFGEHVEAVGGRASPTLACHYVPNLIVSAGAGSNRPR